MRFKSWLTFRWFYPLYIGHFIRRMHFWDALRRIPRNKQPKIILDIGCGSGAYAYEVAKRFTNAIVKGIDLDIVVAVSRWPSLPNLTFEIGDATKLVENNHYDLIYCIDVIDDIQNWELALENFKESLKKYGFLYIHFPKHPRIVHVLKIKQLNEYWGKDASYSHAQCSGDDLKANLKKLGFDIIYESTTHRRIAVLAQEISLLLLMKSELLGQVLRYTIHPFLKLLAKSDLLFPSKFGNGLAILCQKR